MYDRPQTPLDRLLASGGGDPAKIAALEQLRQRLNPFALADEIERKLQQIYRLANHRQSPRLALVSTPPASIGLQSANPLPSHTPAP